MGFGYDPETKKRKKMTKPEFKPKETLKDIQLLPFVEWPERGIRKETMERFGVRAKLSEEFGPSQIDKLYFPAKNHSKKIVGYQVKDLTKDKVERFHFYNVGVVKTSCAFFGGDLCRKNSKFLVIAEGPVDCLSIYQSLIDYQQQYGKEEYKNLTPSVVSLMCGTASALEQVSNNEEFLGNWKEIRLCFDNDELSEYEQKKHPNRVKGKECTETVGSYLIHKDVKVVEYPDWKGFKDPSSFVQKGKPDALAKMVLFDAKPFVAEKISKFSDILTFEDAVSPIEEGTYIDTLPIFMDKLKGIRLYENTVLTSFSSTGKSSYGFEICYQCAKKGHKIGLIMLEERPKKTVGRVMARYCHVHPNLFKFDPKKYVKENKLKEAWNWANEEGKFKVLNHFGSIKTEKLMEKIRFLVFSEGCDIILFDHISLSISGLMVDNERKELDIAMTELQSFCSANPVHIFVVAHVNRGNSAGFTRPKEEPVWRRVGMEYIRGTSGIEGNADNIIGIHREDLPNGERGRIQPGLLKNRNADSIGDCDIIRMDSKTGLFYDASGEVYNAGEGY